MCGIVGIYNVKNTIDLELLNKARNRLSHRGPDGNGTWLSTDHHIGLAHSRLSIVDAKGGAQPLSNHQKTIHASVNGEFYNYAALRQQLENKGYVFSTNSDSELALHLYEAFDLDFVQYLRGEFAFILYDERKKRMLAVRDRFGIKPLCYYTCDGLFLAASEAKALFELGVKPAWNEDALYHSFCFQYQPIDQTLFSAIQQVPPGHMIIYDGKSILLKQYWDLNYYAESNPESYNLENLSNQLDAQLKEAINLRLQVDPALICCHLSGGVDSASIAAISNELYGRPLPCFSVAFPHEEYNEIQFAQRQAQKIGSPFHPVFVEANDLTDVFTDAVYYSEGLAINNHLSAKYILNREIKKAGFKIALTGEGSDELFAGYLHLQQDYLAQPITDNIASGIHISNDKTMPLDYLKERMGYIPSFIKAKAAIGYKIHELLDEVCDKHQQGVRHQILKLVSSKQLIHCAPVYQSTYLWIKLALSGYILRTLGDGCEMAHGIEGRTPFLDHHLFEFAKTIPLTMKITSHADKFILRHTVKNYVTKEIYERKKHPFIAPPFSLLTNKKGYEFMRDNLNHCDRVPFINKAKVVRYIDSLPDKTAQEQIAAEPAIMLILTATLLGQCYSM